MNQHKLFNKTRWRLALSYAIVMSVILSLLGIGIYRVIFHSHSVNIDNTLESIAGTLHDSLELKLKKPGQIEPVVQHILPHLCIVEENCEQQLVNTKRHILSPVNHGDYYIRFFDLQGRLIASAGATTPQLPQKLNPERWQTLKDSQGIIYHQISLIIHTQTGKDWGYLQLGRNLTDFLNYFRIVRWIVKSGLLISFGLVIVSSWWLAGLAMQPIYKSYKQIEQFTADAAHELRTPLAATQATVESALLMPQLDEHEIRDILATLHRQNQRLTTLVTDLLLLARMDRQAIPVKRQICHLHDIISDLIEELAALAINAQVSLQFTLLTQIPLAVVGDEDQLYRLISNLIINGIQYTPAGGQVTIILDRSNGHAVIEIQDTGIGIAPQEQKQIFHRFYRVNSDRSRSTGGSGLGLAIAQAIVQTHRGTIQVKSEMGKGSTFIVRLPLGITPSGNISLNPIARITAWLSRQRWLFRK
ncbi:MAG: two-component system sensor histidine kinase RppB [Nostocaceae cyanobacterium]|nr:two-component system sensor histidine kinase RppB [Nostocaceae cyanobacterium]